MTELGWRRSEDYVSETFARMGWHLSPSPWGRSALDGTEVGNLLGDSDSHLRWFPDRLATRRSLARGVIDVRLLDVKHTTEGRENLALGVRALEAYWAIAHLEGTYVVWDHHGVLFSEPAVRLAEMVRERVPNPGRNGSGPFWLFSPEEISPASEYF